MELVRIFFEPLNFTGAWKLGLLDGRHLIIQLTIEEDYDKLFAKQSIVIGGATMKLFKWTPGFDPSKEPPVVPLWIKLPGLPIPYFKLNALFNIGSALGRPLKVDSHTFNKSRLALARILNERDIALSEVKRVWVGSEQDGFWQEVILEQRPCYCQHCKIFGHTRDRCYRLYPPMKMKQSSLKETALNQLPGVIEDGIQDEDQNSPTPFTSITPPSPPKEVPREEPNIITILSPIVGSSEERL
ncbi:uncharacterized protein LOC110035509 [Phalaenopsis equestris]|uniref:uncharacterized protein LOC110035509 n=1 Tax=Phalaenopsis equestris TaxID=78828 RepID=UPI0009E4A61E|nr:uncharacterized protein LOC110035509 [Phalaenopsis equestris]